MHIISGLYRSRKIETPKGLATRPTSSQLRESLFNICQHNIEGARFLDLFAGSGAMALEALSRGAKSIACVDNTREAIKCMQHNVQQLGVEKSSQVLYGDVFVVMGKLAKTGQQYEIIYADPPYVVSGKSLQDSLSLGERVLQQIDQGSLLAPGGVLFVEDSKEAFPYRTPLTRLRLVNTRHMGRSMLQQYVFIEQVANAEPYSSSNGDEGM